MTVDLFPLFAGRSNVRMILGEGTLFTGNRPASIGRFVNADRYPEIFSSPVTRKFLPRDN